MFTDPFYHTFNFLSSPSSFVFFLFFFSYWFYYHFFITSSLSFCPLTLAPTTPHVCHKQSNYVSLLILYNYSSLSNYPPRPTLIISSPSSSFFSLQTPPSLRPLYSFLPLWNKLPLRLYFCCNFPLLFRMQLFILFLIALSYVINILPIWEFYRFSSCQALSLSFPSNISPVPPPTLRSLFLCRFQHLSVSLADIRVYATFSLLLSFS